MGKYRPIIVTAECGTLTRAGKILGYTQPSLGYIISNLESELGVKIFHRDQRGVRLTEAGAEAAPDLDALNKRADIIDCLDADERAQFEALIDKVTASITAKLEEKGIDPHAMRRGPHHGPQGPGPRCGGPEGPHMLQRGPYGAPDGFGGPGRCGRGGHHGMHQA